MLNILGSTYLGRDRIIFTARKRSCGKVMFLQVSVILFTGGCQLLGDACSQSGGGACSQGEGCLVQGGACSGGVSAPRGCLALGVALGGSGPGGVPGGDPPTVTATGGTHPTGMHSCILFLEQQPTFFRYLFLHLTTQ